MNSRKVQFLLVSSLICLSSFQSAAIAADQVRSGEAMTYPSPSTAGQSGWTQPSSQSTAGQSGWTQPGQSDWTQPSNSQAGQSGWTQPSSSFAGGQSGWVQPSAGGGDPGQSGWTLPSNQSSGGQSGWVQPSQTNTAAGGTGQSGWVQPSSSAGGSSTPLLGEVLMQEQQAGTAGSGMPMGAGAMSNGMPGGTAGMGGGAMGAGGLADLMGGAGASGMGGMNMPLNSVGGALQVLDFVMNAMPSKNSGAPAMMGAGGMPASSGGFAVPQKKKPLPIVGGVGTTMNRSVNRGINRGINMGVNRSVGRAMRAIHF